MEIGKRLRELREAKGLSQRDFARRTGFLQPFICRAERGHRVPTLPILAKWAKALRVELHEFFHDDRWEPLPPSPKPSERLPHYKGRLFRLLSRLNKADRQLFLTVASGLARRARRE